MFLYSFCKFKFIVNNLQIKILIIYKVYKKKIDFVNINKYKFFMIKTSKNTQNRQENQRSDGSDLRQSNQSSSIFSRHDDVCFFDQDPYQESRKD